MTRHLAEVTNNDMMTIKQTLPVGKRPVLAMRKIAQGLVVVDISLWRYRAQLVHSIYKVPGPFCSLGLPFAAIAIILWL